MLPRKVTRLREMRGSEIAYRIRDWASIERERHVRRNAPARPPRRDDLPRGGKDDSFLGYLRERASWRFYASVTPASRRRLTRIYSQRFPAKLAATWDEAERLCAHRMEILGHGEIDLGSVIEWHRDPVTGKPWERRFWSDYDLTRESSAGDPKRVLELNRHQHLPRLAKAFWLFDQERFAREVLDQMESWIDQNPPGIGVHWHVSHEVALRSISWLWALVAIAPTRALDEERARGIGSALFEQLDHVHRHPSLYTSPNTHLLGEALALFVGGLAFGDGARPRAWLATGAELLASQLERQVGADGVHAELSTWYHCHALDGYLQALVLARRHGWPLRLERVERMLDFLLHLSRPDGSVPRFSDDDGGRTLALAQTHYGDVSDLLCTGAILFDRGDLKDAAREMSEESLWLTGPEGLARFDGLEPAAPPPLTAAFPDAGYFVQRSGFTEEDSHLVFDCGGPGSLGGGHAHADALSFTLHSRGRELLVDPGTFVYNGMPQWRDAFRSTAAHNTAIVDGLDAWEPGATFHWRRTPAPRLLADLHVGGIDHLAGEVDSGAKGVLHRRQILFARPDYWLLLDDFRGNGEHTYDVVFHLAPHVEVRRVATEGDDETLQILSGDAGLLMRFQSSANLEVRVVRAGTRPLGWVSQRYGEMQAAPVIVARVKAPAPAALLTLLAPFRAGLPAPEVTRLDVMAPPGAGPVLAASVRLPRGAEDVVVMAAEPVQAHCELVGEGMHSGNVVWTRREGAAHRTVVIDGATGSVLEGPSAPQAGDEEVQACAR